MKILFQSRKTLFSVPGGDTIQLMKTAEYLRIKGCTVNISTELEPDLSSYDFVHLFNLTRPQELFLQTKNARKYNKKVALSPIFVNYNEFERKGRTGIIRLLTKYLTSGQIDYLKVFVRAFKNREINKGTWKLLLHGFARQQSKIIEMVDIFLPNSESEMKRVCQDFPNSSDKRYVVVPNAVDAKIFGNNSTRLGQEKENHRDRVLCVARIEGIKNQLNLVRAITKSPYKLVLIGKPAPNHLAYYKRIVREADSSIQIIGQINHADLPAYYRRSRVHVLPSWMETTGLSTLEAGAMGCQIVVTEKGDTRDYFGDYAFYCEPDSVESIRDAIEKAWNTKPDGRLRDHILTNFSWERTAEKTLEGYETA